MKLTKITVGPKAYSFTDQSTGLSISKGEIKEVTLAQLRTYRVQRALNQGHLVYVQGSIKDYKKYSDADIAKLTKKIRNQYKRGVEPSKVVKNYSLEELKLIAKNLGYEVSPDDTAEGLAQTILDEFTQEEEKEEQEEQ